MQIKTPISLISVALFALAACGEDPPAKDASSANNNAAGQSSPKKGSGDDSSSKSDDKKGGDSEKKESKGGGGGGGGKLEISCKGEPKAGKSASTFSLPAIGGGKTGLEKGKVTIVDFWATWCEPCKKSFPKYQELYVKYKSSGLEIVAVSVDDDKGGIPDFIKTYGAKFPVGWDEGHKIAECYKPPSMPSAFVIDKNGTIKHVHTGYHDGEEKELEKEIKSLL